MTSEGRERRSPRGGDHALTALRHRNFRLIWFGQLLSMIGGQTQQVAIAWHLYELTNSPFHLGLVGAFSTVPFIVLSFVGGAIADKFDRKRIMLTTQALTMCVPLVLLAATLTGHVSPALIYALSFMSGMTRAFDAPARQALIPNLVPQEDLAKALTLNTMLRQLATIVGPNVGGIILGFFGFAVSYAVNAVTFMAIIGALLIMDPLPPIPKNTRKPLELAMGGFRFVRGEPVVMSILCMDFLINILGSVRALFPVFAEEVLNLGPQALGLMYSAPAIGAVTGGVILGAVGTRWRHPAIILVTAAGFGLFTAGFGLAGSYPVALLMLFGTGFMDVVGEILRTTIVQIRTPDELRGRVTSFTVIFTNGGPQLGNFQAGTLASLLGPVEAVAIGGAGVLLTVAGFGFNRHMRTMPPEPRPVLASQPQTAGSGG